MGMVCLMGNPRCIWKASVWRTPMRWRTASLGGRTAGYMVRKGVQRPQISILPFPKTFHFWGRRFGDIIPNHKFLRFFPKVGAIMPLIWKLTRKGGSIQVPMDTDGGHIINKALIISKVGENTGH